MDVLTKLFGGIAYVKVMRLFLFNPDSAFETKDVRARTRVTLETARREVARIHNLGLVKKKIFTKEKAKKIKKELYITKRKVRGWILDEQFPFTESLRHILLNNDSFHKKDVVQRFKNVGRLKLLVISGVFVDEMGQTDTRDRVDMLLVGDHLKQRVIRATLKNLETEVGCELQYAVMKTDDFLYRRDVYDRFVRDIFDYPHEILVDKLSA